MGGAGGRGNTKRSHLELSALSDGDDAAEEAEVVEVGGTGGRRPGLRARTAPNAAPAAEVQVPSVKPSESAAAQVAAQQYTREGGQGVNYDPLRSQAPAQQGLAAQELALAAPAMKSGKSVSFAKMAAPAGSENSPPDVFSAIDGAVINCALNGAIKGAGSGEGNGAGVNVFNAAGGNAFKGTAFN
eukprot:450957-Pleurochrysis_carterae.AAC.1